jgi:ribosomal protein S18 acetylase RimI-like enzyme
VVEYRTFRNGDPPLLADVWNVSLTGRGAVQIRSPSLLERYVYSKPYFDPAGLFLAIDNGHCLGFAHAGGCRSEEDAEIHGVVSVVCVRPNWRRRGVGSQLLYHCEEYLLQQAARKIFAGEHDRLNPFYIGLYGGADSPGVLKSDGMAEGFFRRHRYQVRDVVLVLQRKLNQALRAPDSRFAQLRQRFNFVAGSPRQLGGWWEECTLGVLEPTEFAVEDRERKQVAARAFVWEMEGYSYRWGKPSIGIVGFEVHPEYRSQGLGKLLLTNILRQMQEQFFEIAEIQVLEKNLVALSLLRSFGFETVDRGQVFLKTT